MLFLCSYLELTQDIAASAAGKHDRKATGPQIAYLLTSDMQDEDFGGSNFKTLLKLG